MGQIVQPTRQDILLTDVDRLTARNAASGMAVGAAHIIAFGEDAARNLGDVDNVIAIGANALDAGLNDTAANGAIAIGVNALGSYVNMPFLGYQDPSIAIGVNALAAQSQSGSCTILGSYALASLAGGIASGVTAIGCNVLRNNTNPPNFANSVFVGHNVGQGFSSHGMADCTIIGGGAFFSTTVAAGNVWNGVTAIGTGAIQFTTGVGAGNGGVYIGPYCAANKNSGGNEVMIGGGIVNTDGQNSVSIGVNNVVNTANHLVQLGCAIDGARGDRSILIGFSAGAGETTPTQADTLIIETNVSGTRRTAFYGDMANGNLIAGLSVPGTNRDMRGSNTFKLLNGGKGAGNPVGGGFFYVVAGALHWVGSAGTDTVVAPA